jgi:hypothetical protein
VIDAANKRIREVAADAADQIFAKSSPEMHKRRATKRKSSSHSSAGKLGASSRTNSKKVKRGKGTSLISKFPALAKF